MALIPSLVEPKRPTNLPGYVPTDKERLWLGGEAQ